MARVSLFTAAFFVASAGPAFNFRGSGQMREEEVAEVLKMEEDHDTQLLEELKRDLSDMYVSLPKNEHGKVDHQGVRYALHRFFAKRHGWFIRGLEPGGSNWTPQRLPNGELPPAWVKEWVPTFLQEKLEQGPGRQGMNLHDLAAMAATLEDLVYKEVGLRLQMVYRVHGEPMSGALPRAKADDVLSTFYMTFLLANNLTANSRAHLLKKKQVFARSYRGYQPAREWFDKTVSERLGDAQAVDFQAASQVVNDVGLKYHAFNQLECSELRETLRKMESRKPGRVRLSVFYNMSRFTHWRFTEKADYLKKLGALDDSDPKQPSLITANYIMARPNCLDASNLYSLCCTNVCEDLMSHLERGIGNATAKPERIIALVSDLKSEDGEARTQLSPLLVRHLGEIASYHGGEVPLHGRLFAQWMHHAYPRKCPFPHESGSISPQTAEEWTRETGSSEQSSDTERQRIVDDDVCLITAEGKVECGDESDELPWNPVEELLTSAHHDEQRAAGSSGYDVLCFIAFGTFIASAALFAASNAHRAGDRAADCQHQVASAVLTNTIGVVAAVAVALLVLAALGLLDETVFAFALFLSFVLYMTSSLAKRKIKVKHEKLWA